MKAISFMDGNALINAGSGAGKTHVLTARVANLVANHKIEPKRVLALTFTKEAANNMKERLKPTIGSKADEIGVYTFHSFAYGIMRSSFPSMYNGKTIIQGWWKTRKMFDIVGKRSRNNPTGLDMGIRAGELEAFISYQKSNMIREGMSVIIDLDVMPYLENESKRDLQLAFDTYCESVRFARLIEFDDMLVEFYYKLTENEDFLTRIKESYDYIMVDEFQDTNTISLEIIKLISDNNLFVVGDFRQGIYGFINANIDNILNFSDDVKNVETIELQENFRSTENIVDFANDIIKVSPVEKYKKFGSQISSSGKEGSPVVFEFHNKDIDETVDIGNSIKNLVENEGYKYNEFAILCRTNNQLGIYESEFTDMEIPVDVSNSRSFFDRKEISDLLAYSAHALDASDDMSMRKIMNSPNRFISNAIIGEIDKYAYDNNLDFEVACERFDSHKYKGRILGVVDSFQSMRKHLDENASRFLKEVYKITRYGAHINKTAKTTSEVDIKNDAINRLFEMAKRFSSIRTFLAHVSIVVQNGKKDNDGVKLMTVHGSKGLEFDYVFVPSAIDSNYPHDMNSDYEEERRLFYVACTRAKDKMVISAPMYIGDGGETNKLSPFILDMAGAELEDAFKQVMYGADKFEYQYTGLKLKESVV